MTVYTCDGAFQMALSQPTSDIASSCFICYDFIESNQMMRGNACVQPVMLSR